MSVYMVTWNLNKERGNYDQSHRAFIAHLERYPNVRDSGLETVRWIESNATPTQVNDDLKLKLDDNDRIFITKVNNGERQGWLDKNVWDWINVRV